MSCVISDWRLGTSASFHWYCYYSLARNTAVLSPKEAGAKARQAAEKALELDPSLGEAHASLGNVLLVFEWEFAGAEREFQRAIDLNPAYPYSHQWYAELLYATGRYEESIQETARQWPWSHSRLPSKSIWACR